MARSCGFWRIRIAAPATARTTPRTTAAAIHSQGFGLATSTLGATGRWISASGLDARPGRSNSAATSGASADCTGSSRRVATTGGAPDSCASSALVGRTALPGSSAATPGKPSSLPPFAPTEGAARPEGGLAIAAASWDRAGEAAVDAAARPPRRRGWRLRRAPGRLAARSAMAAEAAAPPLDRRARPGLAWPPVWAGDRAGAADGPGAAGAAGRWTGAG